MRDCRGIASPVRAGASHFRRVPRTRASSCARLAREGVKTRGNRAIVEAHAGRFAQPRCAALENVRSIVTDRYVVFSHGKDAGPWGVKITALAGNARSEGYEVESVDYRGIDDPRERVNKLVEFCKELKGDLVLCGSSLGGYVSVAAASLLHARGVFLMAPALTMPGLPPLREKLLDCPTTIVHGWKDDVVPVEQSIEFARRHGCALHILNSDHRLQDEVRFLKYLFEYFLISLDLPQDVSVGAHVHAKSPRSGVVLNDRNFRMDELSQLIQRAHAGDEAARERLFAVAYEDLRGQARAQLRDGGRNTLLNTTVLLHESFLRFQRAGKLAGAERGHFFAYAARVMRSVIVDFARQRQAERRGGDAVHLPLDAQFAENLRAGEDEVIQINDAIEALQARGSAPGAGGGNALFRRHDRTGNRRRTGRHRPHGPARLGEGAAVAGGHAALNVRIGRVTASV